MCLTPAFALSIPFAPIFTAWFYTYSTAQSYTKQSLQQRHYFYSSTSDGSRLIAFLPCAATGGALYRLQSAYLPFSPIALYNSAKPSQFQQATVQRRFASFTDVFKASVPGIIRVAIRGTISIAAVGLLEPIFAVIIAGDAARTPPDNGTFGGRSIDAVFEEHIKRQQK